MHQICLLSEVFDCANVTLDLELTWSQLAFLKSRSSVPVKIRADSYSLDTFSDSRVHTIYRPVYPSRRLPESPDH